MRQSRKGRFRPPVRAFAKRLATRLGMDVVDDPIYSPVPKVPPPGDAIWSRRHPLDGIAFDVDAQLGFVERELSRHLEEFERDVRGRGFDVWNELYKGGDAELLYAMVRHLKPARVLELGSGFSTLISAEAAVANRRDGVDTQVLAVDPAPRTSLREGIDGLAGVQLADAREVPPETFAQLERNDVLFIDTSHAVKLGSEVNWLVLEVLPRLRPGVYVQFHDVFIPYEYPRYLLEIPAYFNEQYLLHAFLMENQEWGVVLGACALMRERRERLAELIPSLAQVPAHQPSDYVPAAFWIRRSERP